MEFRVTYHCLYQPNVVKTQLVLIGLEGPIGILYIVVTLNPKSLVSFKNNNTSMADSGSDSSSFFRCRNCQTPIALRTDLLSKSFRAKSGAAFMFSHARNIIEGAKQDKQLITGMFTITNIYCSNCGLDLGWKYIKAFEPSQKYKEGNFIIEKAKIFKQFY